MLNILADYDLAYTDNMLLFPENVRGIILKIILERCRCR